MNSGLCQRQILVGERHSLLCEFFHLCCVGVTALLGLPLFFDIGRRKIYPRDNRRCLI